ncbi:hypothetical protein [Streptomyces sp. SBT349]|uniref:hypothetical protein n=1 Tax=Streptomyces sp. SBT349 TaxID=1580539 RepID=UPI0018FE8370|nr:hypothetical protein [Streptomyces sp. SBT349]
MARALPVEAAVPETPAELGPSFDEAGSWCWPYRWELPVDGELVVCAVCGADRDWLLILFGEAVSVRCRCTHQWHEPRLPADWFRRECGDLVEVHPNPAHADRTTGFDGTFAGTYW